MKLLSPIRSLIAKKKPVRRLIVESNGFLIKAAIAEVNNDEFSILDFAQSTKPSADAALDEVLKNLKTRHPKLPASATLISSQAAASILELPINPQAPFRHEEVHELVRWEFEQQLAEQTASLTLDTVLVGRNLLSESDIDDAREQLLAQNSGSISITSAPTKFADQVVKMGLVDRADVEDSIKLLEAYYVPDDEPVCNFFPLAEEGDAPGEAGFPWLVCGIGQAIQRAWVARFESHDIRIERIYPIGFVSCAAFTPPQDEKSYGILDLLEGVDCYVSYSGNRLKTLRWGPAPLSARNPEALVNLVGADRIENLWLSGESRVIRPVASAITHELKVGVRTFGRPPTDTQLNGSVASVRFDGMLGALRHQESLTEQTLPWVEGAGPGPPWWKQAARWWTIVSLTLTVLILASEISLVIRRHSVQWALDQISDQVETVKGEIAKVEGATKVAKDLEGSIEKSTENLKVKNTALGLIRDGLSLRAEYSKTLFLALAHSVTPNVAVNEFREERDHSVNLEAWAVTEKESQEFIRSIVEALTPWGLNLTLHQVRLQPGRLGLPGYHIQIELRPNPSFPE